MFLAHVTDGMCGSWFEGATKEEAVKGVAKCLQQDWKLPDDFEVVANVFDIGNPDSWVMTMQGLYLTNGETETGPHGPIDTVVGPCKELQVSGHKEDWSCGGLIDL